MINLKNKTNIFDDVSYISSVCMSSANENQSEREHYTQLATITRNKLESKYPDKLFTRLLSEAENNTPSRPTEFIPVKLYVDFWNNMILLKNFNGEVIKVIETIDDRIHFYNVLMPFSHIKQFDEYNILYTNLRALINYGLDYENIPFNDDCSEFKCIVGKIPKFVYDHLVVHTQLSTESSSIRINKDNDIDMWYPNNKELKHILTKTDDKIFKDITKLHETFNYKYELGLRDISSRRYVSFVMTGWMTNYNAWKHLFEERGASNWTNWTQTETKDVVKLIKKLIIGTNI